MIEIVETVRAAGVMFFGAALIGAAVLGAIWLCAYLEARRNGGISC